MRKITKIMAIIFMSFIMPITVYAAKDETDTYEYEVEDNKAVLTKYATSSNATRITVPSEVDGYKVVQLGNTFRNNQSVREVIIPDGVEILGGSTFANCTSLEKVKLPETIKEIRGNTFYKCSNLKSIKLPESLQIMGRDIFYECDSLEELEIPANVSYIEEKLLSISGENLKRIINRSNQDFDNIICAYNGKIWFTSETGDELANNIPANSTIYLREKIKIQEIELSITCTKPNENIKKENIQIDLKTEHCYIREINIMRYNQACIWVLPDNAYDFSTTIGEWAKLNNNNISIDSISYSVTPDGYPGIYIAISNNALTEISDGDTSQIILDKYADVITLELKKIKEEQISMLDANTIESVESYIKNRLPEPPNSEIEVSVIADKQRFRAAVAGKPGTIKDKVGEFGSCFFNVRIWEKKNKETLRTLTEYASIQPTKYTSSSGNGGSSSSSGGNGTGSSGNNSGGSSSSGGSGGGGGKSRSSYGSSSTTSQGLFITKPSVISGTWELVNGKWKLKISDTTYASLQWANIDNKWYLIGQDSYMLTGWQMANNKWYLLNADGCMLVGWQFKDGKWYYMDLSGEMVTGWIQIGEKYYYMDNSGMMLSNTTTPDGYTVNENGEWVQ